jgi:hypothetical protein
MGVLLFSNFPPAGSTLVEKHEEEAEDAEEREPLVG